MDIYDISASALTAQRLRMDVIAGNLANVNTTRKSDGTLGAYHRRNVVFSPILDKATKEIRTSSGMLAGTLPMRAPGSDSSGMTIGPNGRPMLTAIVNYSDDERKAMGVQVATIKDDTETPMKMVYDPSHPDANEDGYVEMPNINVVSEMVDMISASRAYEANVSSFQAAKAMGKAAIEM